MALYQAFDPNVHVNGETILSVINGMKFFKSGARKILRNCGINDPCPGEWYSQQAWLDAFKDIEKTLGPVTLFNIGKSIPQSAIFPPHIHSITDALHSINEAYKMNHRGGEIGSYKFKQVNERVGKMLCQNPYPCDFDFGIITAVAERFKPQNSKKITVLHPPSARCRKKGDDGCIYAIAW